LVAGWNVDFVITLGDNNYQFGRAATIDDNIGRHYQRFIGNYRGEYGPGSSINRFFPTLGNHDWRTTVDGLPKPYLDYFTLPGNERYYNYTRGPVEFFALDSDRREPDGTTPDSPQGVWLREALNASTTPWQFVYMHHAPYHSSSALRKTAKYMRWNYRDWGADAVLAGHAHVYERLTIDGIPYFVNGLGGAPIYRFGKPLSETEVRYNAHNGALLVTVNAVTALFEFYSTASGGTLIDSYSISKRE
jgi:hypothetical protein